MSALAELRARIGALTSRNTERLAFSLVPEGLPRGGLVEISGRGKTEAAVRFLAENPLPAAWIEERFSLFPTALLQREVDPARILFLEGGKEAAWAAAQVLRSQLFPILIYSAPYGEERELRRFQLLSETAKTTMLLLRPQPSKAWPIALQLRMEGGELRARKR